MACKLTQSIRKESCQYQVAGLMALYLINWSPDHVFSKNTDGEITDIELANNEKAFVVDFESGTGSWTDDLTVGGNNAKYRTHTVNFSISDYTYRILNQSDALSLGRFIAIVIDKSGRIIVLGRNNGLSATSHNYASGAADADATGWTTVLAGTEVEVAPLVLDKTILSPIIDNDTPTT